MKIFISFLFLFLSYYVNSQNPENSLPDMEFSLNGDTAEMDDALTEIENVYKDLNQADLSAIRGFLQSVLDHFEVSTSMPEPNVFYYIEHLAIVQIDMNTSDDLDVWVSHFNINSKRGTTQNFDGSRYNFHFRGYEHNQLNILAAVSYNANDRRSERVQFIITDMDKL